MEEVEVEGGQRHVGTLPCDIRLSARPAGSDLEWPRPPVGVQRHRFTVQDGRPDVECECLLDDLGNPGGDVVEGPGEDGDAGFVAMDLDADPVDLPFHRGR